jgi:hypothetical protein
MRACAHARVRHGSNEGWTVTVADLQAIEGEHGALSQHSDEVLAEVTTDDPERLAAAEWLFRSLTDLDAEGRIIRRPRRLGDIVAVANGNRTGCSPSSRLSVLPAAAFLSPTRRSYSRTTPRSTSATRP